MTDGLLDELLAARPARRPWGLVTIAGRKGSMPRAAGAKMLVYLDGLTSVTIGGGKFEALAIAEALVCLREKRSLLKTFPLHENEPDSFGAICGGEATILIEPLLVREALFVVGAGHCAPAIVRLAVDCGLFVNVMEDRAVRATGIGYLGDDRESAQNGAGFRQTARARRAGGDIEQCLCSDWNRHWSRFSH
jgi:xanthine dehydrogenase accessory factor